MKIAVGESYTIRIENLSKDHLIALNVEKYAGVIILVDENTQKFCLPTLKKKLPLTNSCLIVVSPGELHKNVKTCQKIWQEMFDHGVGRRWLMLNLGGGVIGDMGGFVASTYKRGIDFVQIPTTLLSQVDASVGGKLGIDFYGVKNSIGLFANPQAVWIDTDFLDTLPAREIRSGYAEILKHALIADNSQWDTLHKIHDLSSVNWRKIIPESVIIKRDIVEQDPHERGIRKALNFGHTIGHAIESYWLETDARLLHGEAIAAGMIMESWLSLRQTGLPKAQLDKISEYILSIYGHQSIPTEAWPDLLSSMKQDKKNEDDRINFTLLRQIGQAEVNQTATPDEIRGAFDYYNSL